MPAARAALLRLQLSGYTEDNLCRFFRIPVASDARYVPAPPADERPRRALGAWFALFVAGEALPSSAFPAADLDPLIHEGLVEQLPPAAATPSLPPDRSVGTTALPSNRSADVAELRGGASGETVRARVAVLPIAGVLVICDRFDAVDADAPDLSAVNVAHCLPARLDGKRVLDVGCGSGLLSVVAAQRGAQVCGGDIHEPALAHARRNAQLSGLDITFSQSDLFGGFGSRQFDLILFNAPLLRAALAQANDAPARYTTSPLGEALALSFVREVGQHLAPGGEVLLHAQVTAALAEALAGFSAVQVVFARAPDGTPHALTSIRPGEPGVRRFEVPLSRFCPHLSRPILDALHAEGGDDPIWYPAPWLELRDTRRLGTAADRALSFGAHVIDAEDLALLERLQTGNLPTSSLDPSDLARLFRLAALGLLVRR